ncbi:hypothetical protein ACI65C_009363 [Semiaphis heraclei]
MRLEEKAGRPRGVATPVPTNGGRATLPHGRASHRPTAVDVTATSIDSAPPRPNPGGGTYAHRCSEHGTPRQCSVSGFSYRSTIAAVLAAAAGATGRCC